MCVTSLATDLPLVRPDTCLGLQTVGIQTGASVPGLLPTPPSPESTGRPSALVHISQHNPMCLDIQMHLTQFNNLKLPSATGRSFVFLILCPWQRRIYDGELGFIRVKTRTSFSLKHNTNGEWGRYYTVREQPTNSCRKDCAKMERTFIQLL